MGWTGRAPAPEGSQSERRACQEKEHRHASHGHRSRSNHHGNRYGQEHTAHDWPRFARRDIGFRSGWTARRATQQNCNSPKRLLTISLSAATHPPLPEGVIHVGLRAVQPLPLFAQLRTYRCVALIDAEGQNATSPACETCLPINTLPRPGKIHLPPFERRQRVHDSPVLAQEGRPIPVGQAVPALRRLWPRFSPPKYRPAGSADCRAAAPGLDVFRSRSNGRAR